MTEDEIRAIFKRIRKAQSKGREPSDADFILLLEGALVNLSKLANPSK